MRAAHEVENTLFANHARGEENHFCLLFCGETRQTVHIDARTRNEHNLGIQSDARIDN